MEGVKEGLSRAKNWVVDNMDWLLPLAFVVAVVVAALWLLVLWLSSRGRFMFLYCVAGNRAEVVRPWNDYAAQGNSLFVFRLILSVAGLVVILPFLAGAGWSVFSMISAKQADSAGILISVSLVLAAAGIGMILAVITKLTQDFVVPIMYLRALSCWEGWREFRSLLGQHFWMVMLYLLFQIALLLAIQLGTLLIVLVTCCLAGCLLAIPYLGTVFFLPVLVFERSYSLYFLAQFGPRYNVFPPEQGVTSEEHGKTW